MSSRRSPSNSIISSFFSHLQALPWHQRANPDPLFFGAEGKALPDYRHPISHPKLLTFEAASKYQEDQLDTPITHFKTLPFDDSEMHSDAQRDLHDSGQRAFILTLQGGPSITLLLDCPPLGTLPGIHWKLLSHREFRVNFYQEILDLKQQPGFKTWDLEKEAGMMPPTRTPSPLPLCGGPAPDQVKNFLEEVHSELPVAEKSPVDPRQSPQWRAIQQQCDGGAPFQGTALAPEG
ncbi:hypothetical protein JD844_013964 [Phrynosoma platyrhinos]|uniref:Uncharacterized protein n=1 Tax=Phrynosoma platyrhinos TaxID=52577 RepID=A0ABQ7TLX8_PHRPL|nr:hypothetical protein JD844_013964 [Phrynosoma platyrhinos]